MNSFILTDKCYYFEIDESVELDRSKLVHHVFFNSIDELYLAASKALNCPLEEVIGNQLYVDQENCWQDSRRLATKSRVKNVADFINTFEM
jgi:hypothetical protein